MKSTVHAAAVETAGLPFLDPDLPLESRITDLLTRLTLDEKIGLMASRQEAVARLGLGEYHIGGEAAHGLVARDGPSTVFPQTVGLACTWDEDLLRRIGSCIGDEARAYYRKRRGVSGLTLWAPTIDMERDPRWGRTEEAYGEDPVLTGRLSSAYIRGMSGDHPFYIKAVATPKHFYANNNEKDRSSCSSSVDPRNRREYYLKAFEPAFTEAGAHSVMTSYNAINGIPAMLHPDLNRVVKGEWNMDGFVVCDGGAFSMLVRDHKAFPDFPEAAASALKAGIDNFSDETEIVKTAVRTACERGLISEADLDRALANVFRIRFRLGQFDPPERNPYSSTGDSVLWKRGSRELSLEAARKAIVLLENGGADEPFLPLTPESAGAVAVVGPLADAVFRDWYTGTPAYAVTPLRAFCARLPHDRIRHADGSDVVSFRAEGGRWIGARSLFDVRLAATRTDGHGGERFLRTDWGWGNQTFRSLSNGRYITTDDVNLEAKAPEVWGWYVKERFALEPVPHRKEPPEPRDEDAVILKTWKGDPVGLDPDGGLVVKPSGENGEPFVLEVIHDGTAEAVAAAHEADTAFVFVGNHPLLVAKEEMDRPDLSLPPDQDRLIREVLEANPRTVVVIVGSYPYALGDWKDRVKAVLYTPHGGQEAGNALVDVIFGAYNPSGKLPLTWYRSADDLPDITDYDIIRGKRTYRYFDGTPLYPFGYGLSYSAFGWLSIAPGKATIGSGETLPVEIRIRNDGARDGEEVVQLYASFPASAVRRPGLQLLDFRRVYLKAGETVAVTLRVRASELSFWDVRSGGWFFERGTCSLHAGASSADLRLHADLIMDGKVLPPRNPFVPFSAVNFDDQSDVSILAGGDGTQRVVPRSDGAWIRFDDLDCSGTPPAAIEAETACETEAGSLDISLTDTGTGRTATAVLAIVPGKGFHRIALPAIDPGLLTLRIAFHGTVGLKKIGFSV